jgi:hypothetical protein
MKYWAMVTISILYINSVSLSVRPSVSDKCEQDPDDRVQMSLLPLSLARSHSQTSFVAGSLGDLLAVKTFSSCSPLPLMSLLPLSFAHSHNQTSFVAGTAFFSPICFGFSKISHSGQNSRSKRERVLFPCVVKVQ